MESTSDRFNAGYASKGMQPSTGAVPVRNVEVSYKTKKQARRGERAARTTGRVAGRVMQGTGKATGMASRGVMRAGAALSSTAVGAIVGVPLVAAGAVGVGASKGVELAGKGVTAASGGKGKMSRSSLRAISAVRGGSRFKAKGFSVRGLAGNGKAKIRATRVSMTLISSGFTFWIFFQLPLALISLVFFGLRIAIDSMYAKNATGSEDEGFFTELGNDLFEGALFVATESLAVISAVSKFLLNIDLTEIGDPANYFMATYLVVWGLAMLQLFIVYLLYKLSRVEPLGGKGSGLKYGMLILALIGYSIPLLNIFPWVIFWILAVWKNPK